MTEIPVLADDLTFVYAGPPAVDAVSLEIGPGEFVALVGPNGSGKTTLLKLLLGLLRPRRGRALLFGQEPARLTEPWRVGYVPQRPALVEGLPATVDEIVSTGRLPRGRWRRHRADDREAIDHALQVVGLGDLRDRRVGDLSGGEQQRALIARAVAADPDLLVLDEPVAGVDAEAQGLFREALVHHVRVHGGSVLLVSHELSAVASDLDRVVVMKQSVRFDGPPSELTAAGVSLGVHAEDLPAWLEELR